VRRIATALAAAASFMAAAAVAQTLPSPAEPSADIPVLEVPTLDAFAFEVAVPERGAVPPQLLAERFPLDGVRFRGNSVFSAAELAALFPAPLPGIVTLGDIFAFEDAITAKYRDDGGYQLSFALIPPQEIGDGALLVEIFEGYVERIEVRGENQRLRNRVRALLAPVANQRPMRAATLEERMLLIDDIPGIAVTGTLRPAGSDARAASDFFVEIENTPLTMFTSFDNRGSEYAGYTRVQNLVTVANPGGLPVTLRAFGDIAVPAEEKAGFVLEGEYAAPWGGTTVTLTHARSVANVGGRLRETATSEGEINDFKTKSESIRFGVEHIFLRSRAHTISGGLSIERSSALNEESEDLIFNDRLTVVEASLAYRYRDAPLIGGDGQIRLRARHGLDAAGASREGDQGGDRVSRRDGEVDFTRFNIDLAHRWRLGYGIAFDVRASGQRATTHLLSGEEFGIGGTRYGRAYDFNEYKGEHGFGVSTELSKTIRFEPDWAPAAQLYGFYEIGQVWDTDQAGGPDSQPSIASAGFGARLIAEPIRDGPRVTLYGEKAMPLTRQPNRIFDDGMRARYIIGGSLSVAIDE